jgi:A/G-specific adenine glycosylase
MPAATGSSSASRMARRKLGHERPDRRVSPKPTYAALAGTAVRWHREHERPFPWRESRDPYAVLVGEILLQRTRGDLVEPVFRDFIRRWPSLKRLGVAREETIAQVIRPLGLAKRAHIIKRLGEELKRQGKVPTTPDELLDLPGVGPYAAHAVPVFALDEELPVVDWVIARVLRRYFGLPDDGRPNQDRELWGRATRLIRNMSAREVWLGLLDFASEICKPRPRCEVCPLNRSCQTGRQRLRVRASN